MPSAAVSSAALASSGRNTLASIAAASARAVSSKPREKDRAAEPRLQASRSSSSTRWPQIQAKGCYLVTAERPVPVSLLIDPRDARAERIVRALESRENIQILSGVESENGYLVAIASVTKFLVATGADLVKIMDRKSPVSEGGWSHGWFAGTNTDAFIAIPNCPPASRVEADGLWYPVLTETERHATGLIDQDERHTTGLIARACVSVEFADRFENHPKFRFIDRRTVLKEAQRRLRLRFEEETKDLHRNVKQLQSRVEDQAEQLATLREDFTRAHGLPVSASPAAVRKMLESHVRDDLAGVRNALERVRIRMRWLMDERAIISERQKNYYDLRLRHRENISQLAAARKEIDRKRDEFRSRNPNPLAFSMEIKESVYLGLPT